jgi:predicted nucleic acid-binding protein
VRIWPLDPPIARLYAELFHDLRARGRVLSQVDLVLAATARHLGATLLTTDRDFQAIAGLRIENWLE